MIIEVNPYLLSLAPVVSLAGGYLLGRMSRRIEGRALDELLADELTKHPGANAVVEALQEVREEFEASTTALDLKSQAHEGEWLAGAHLCTRIIALLGGRRRDNLSVREATKLLHDGWYLEHSDGVVYRFRDERLEHWDDGRWMHAVHGVPADWGTWRVVPNPERARAQRLEVARG